MRRGKERVSYHDNRDDSQQQQIRHRGLVIFCLLPPSHCLVVLAKPDKLGIVGIVQDYCISSSKAVASE